MSGIQPLPPSGGRGRQPNNRRHSLAATASLNLPDLSALSSVGSLSRQQNLLRSLGTNAISAQTIHNLSTINDFTAAVSGRLGGHVAGINALTGQYNRLAEDIGRALTTTLLADANSQLVAHLRDPILAQVFQIGSAIRALNNFAPVLLKTPKIAGLTDILGRYADVQAILLTAVSVPQPPVLLRGYTRLAGRRFDAYIDGLPPRPNSVRADVARLGGQVQVGLLAVESGMSENLDEAVQAELNEQFDGALEAWEIGPAAAHRDLLVALDELGHGDLLRGAWEDIERNGPAAATKVANCMVECLDRTLRDLAPPERLLQWIEARGSKVGLLGAEGQPTRRAKVAFILHSRGQSQRDSKLVEAEVDALAKLVQLQAKNFQSVKHSHVTAMIMVRGWVQSTEGLLAQIVRID